MSDLFSSFPDDLTVLFQGASRGLGLAFTKLSLEDDRVGMVIGTSRRPEESDGLLSLRERHGERLQTKSMDVAEPEPIERAASTFAELDRPLSLLLNVAGVLHAPDRGIQPEKKLEDLRPEDAIYSFRVNALGPLLMARAFVPFLDDRRAVIASVSARVGTLAIELGRYRKSHSAICVALHPGTVETELSAPFRSHVKHEIFSPERAARQLLAIIDALDDDDRGRFIAWDGQTIPF